MLPALLLADARVDYMVHCMGCHQMDGSGLEPAVPSFRDLDALLAVPGGREYLVRVPGAAQAPISDERLTAVLNFILQEYASSSPTPAAFTTREVSRLRPDALTDPVTARKDLLTR